MSTPTTPTTVHKLSPGARLRALLTGRVEITPLTTAAPTSPQAARVLSLPPGSLLTLDEWRSSSLRVEYVRALLAAPMFRELLSLVASRRASARGPLDTTIATYCHGWRCGQDDAIHAILAAGTLTDPPPTDIPADYGASESEFANDPNAETPA